MVSGHEKALLKLLKVSGYELTEENAFGFRTYSRLDHTDVIVRPGIPSRQASDLTTLIRRETARERRTEETPAAIVKQREWDASERKRTNREAADRALVADRRLGGLSARLSEAEVDQVTRRAEQIIAARRRTERLMRERPLAYA